MQYFKHMGTMRHDVKIRRLINKYGLEGYGLYNLILESITEKLTTDSPIPDLQETCDDIAEFYNSNSTRISEMANFMINQGLFELDETTSRITCNKIYKFLEQNQTRSKQIRLLIAAWKNNTPLLLETVSDSLETVEDKSDRIEKNRIEKNRIEENISFEQFWKLYNKSASKQKSLKLWNKLNPEIHQTIYKHVIKYVESTPDKQYRKNPDTYLRNECWNDEIISKEQHQPKQQLNTQRKQTMKDGKLIWKDTGEPINV